MKIDLEIEGDHFVVRSMYIEEIAESVAAKTLELEAVVQNLGYHMADGVITAKKKSDPTWVCLSWKLRSS